MVFQNYAIYPHMTVGAEHRLRALHAPSSTRPRSSQRVEEAAAHPRARGAARAPARRRSPAASASASPSAAPWCAIRRPSCSTSRCPTSTRSCAPRCGSRSSACTSGSGTTIVYVTHDQVEAMTHGRPHRGDARRPHPAGRQRRWSSTKTRPTSSRPASSARPTMNMLPAQAVTAGGATTLALGEKPMRPACPAWGCAAARPGRRAAAGAARAGRRRDRRPHAEPEPSPSIEPLGSETFVHVEHRRRADPCLGVRQDAARRGRSGAPRRAALGADLVRRRERARAMSADASISSSASGGSIATSCSAASAAMPRLGEERFASEVSVVPGGGGFITAAHLAAWARRSRCSSRIGLDPLSQAIAPALRRERRRSALA